MKNFLRLLSPLPLAAALLMTACAGPGTTASTHSNALPSLIVERLSWMDEVAQVKQARSLPVTDAKREAELLVAMEKLGTEAGLPASAVRAFFVGQIDAAKNYQKEWLEAHSSSRQASSTATLPDLAKTVRPALDGISTKMIVALAKARRPAKDDTLPQIVGAARAELTRAGYSKAVIAPAIRGLETGLGMDR